MRRAASSLVTLLLSLPLACGPERPPQPEDGAQPAKGDPEAGSADPASFDPETQTEFILSYAGERGVFADCKTIAEVPEDARGRVGVNVFGLAPPTGMVWVTNLDEPSAEGRYPLEAVPRAQFEEEVLGNGRASAFTLPEDLVGSEAVKAPEAPVIVYKTSWCGVCKQLEKYLQRKGVEYVAKDIEADRTAAAELQAKAKEKGVPTGSVPMIDVGGELLRGFDKNALERLL